MTLPVFAEPSSSKRAPWAHRWRSPSASPDKGRVRSRDKWESSSVDDPQDQENELRDNVFVFASRVKVLRTWSACFERARLANEACARAILHWVVNTVSGRTRGARFGMLSVQDTVSPVGSGWSAGFKATVSATEGVLALAAVEGAYAQRTAELKELGGVEYKNRALQAEAELAAAQNTIAWQQVLAA